MAADEEEPPCCEAVTLRIEMPPVTDLDATSEILDGHPAKQLSTSTTLHRLTGGGGGATTLRSATTAFFFFVSGQADCEVASTV